MSALEYTKFWSSTLKELAIELFSSRDMSIYQKDFLSVVWKLNDKPNIKIVERFNGFSILPLYMPLERFERNLKWNYGIKLYSSVSNCLNFLTDERFKNYLFNGNLWIKVVDSSEGGEVTIYVPSFFISEFFLTLRNYKHMNLVYKYKNRKIPIDRIRIDKDMYGRISTSFFYDYFDELQSLYIYLDDLLEVASRNLSSKSIFSAISKYEILNLPDTYNFRSSRKKYIVNIEYNVNDELIYIPSFIIKKDKDSLLLLTISGLERFSISSVINNISENPLAFIA